MALSTSPRKIVPLATGDEARPRNDYTGSSSTKRVFFCGVVVEGSENGRRLPEEIQELVLSLGELLESESESNILSSKSASGLDESDRSGARKRALTDSSALASVISELVTTERSYVKRLQILKNDYADPLRNFSRSKNTAIIPAYEAKTLFGNIDNLLPINEAFLTDLEKMMAPNGAKTVGGVGDVALKHFKELRGFEQYKQYYVKREDAQLIFEREMSKRSSPFAAYIDRIKYQSADIRNRIGLRELLMDPVQRIPRYTLLFRTMIKHMAPGDPQRAKLIEADEIASKIALAEADEQTKRAAIFYCLSATIDGFPADLFSNARHFIDCIDVEDVLADTPVSSAASMSSSSLGSLHCTLFLFDDKLLIVKRPSGEKGGRALSGLDELDKLTKAGGIPNNKKKSGMSCKGVVDITDIAATDVGGADFHLYLENPPQDQSDRWSRAFRALSVVQPPAPVNLDPTSTEQEKQRFLQNLWNVQAKFRARSGQSVVLRAEDMEVESRSGKVTVAQTYYNVYQRTAFLQEGKKTKVVVHVDAQGTADKIPFGIGNPPFVVIRLQPLAGGVCRYKVTSSDPSDPGEEDIVQTARVPSRIVLTIHQFGLFEFRTGRNSRPSTPTARSKVSIFGLDAISRNLFNTRPGTMGDFFGGSVNSHRRTKSTASRSSMYTHTTTTGDGSLMKFSHRSNSTATAATTVSGDDDSSFFSRSPERKTLKRGKSPGGSNSDNEKGSLGRSFVRSLSRSTSRSRSASRDRSVEYSDGEEEDVAVFSNTNASESDLAMQLALARRNSKTQNERQIPLSYDAPVDDIIYEEEPPHPTRPASRASRDSNSQCTVTPSNMDSPPRRSRSMSRNSSERRPLGPRSPSPLPPPKSPRLTLTTPLPDEDIVAPLTHTPHPPVTPTPSRTTGIPRSTRQPLYPTGNTDATPRPSTNSAAGPSNHVEPLSIKKKTSVRTTVTATGSPMPSRKNVVRSSPLSRATDRIVSPRRVSPQIRSHRTAASSHSSASREVDLERVLQLSKTTKEDVDSSCRAVKRIRLEVDGFCSRALLENGDDYSRPSSPSKGMHTPQKATPALTKAAQERLDEMRQAILQRQGEGTPRSRHSGFDTPSRPSADMSAFSRSMDTLLSQADDGLARVASNQESLQNALKQATVSFKERSGELEKTRLELQNAKRQCEVVKSLLTDATTEKEIMYEAFNEELDGMYNDVNLPDDEAWVALTTDLRQTKEARNSLTKENSQLKRRLAEAELKQEEWGALLRAHGLIP